MTLRDQISDTLSQASSQNGYHPLNPLTRVNSFGSSHSGSSRSSRASSLRSAMTTMSPRRSYNSTRAKSPPTRPQSPQANSPATLSPKSPGSLRSERSPKSPGSLGSLSSKGAKDSIAILLLQHMHKRKLLGPVLGVILSLVLVLCMYFLFANSSSAVGPSRRSLCRDATLALRKANLLAGALGERGDSLSVDPDDKRRDPHDVLAAAQATLSGVSLEAAADAGVLFTSVDMDSFTACAAGKVEETKLEERTRTASGIPTIFGDIAVREAAHAKRGRLLSTELPAPQKWDDGQVAYCFARDCSPWARIAWQQAVLHLQAQVPCLSFKEVQAVGENCMEFPSIIITSDSSDGCWSFLGQQMSDVHGARRSQQLNLGLGCETRGMTAHQMGHALGLLHEELRIDRDGSVSIHMEHIAEEMVDGFVTSSFAGVGEPYDLFSVMHSSPAVFSATGRRTLKAKDPLLTQHLGQRLAFSEGDVRRLGRLYGCPDQVKPESSRKRVEGRLRYHAQVSREPWSLKGCLCEESRYHCHGDALCCNPNGNSYGSWCHTEGTCFGKEVDYCKPEAPVAPTTNNGCLCRTKDVPTCATKANGYCCNPNGDEQGSWCYTEKPCQGEGHDYCTPLDGPRTFTQVVHASAHPLPTETTTSTISAATTGTTTVSAHTPASQTRTARGFYEAASSTVTTTTTASLGTKALEAVAPVPLFSATVAPKDSVWIEESTSTTTATTLLVNTSTLTTTETSTEATTSSVTRTMTDTSTSTSTPTFFKRPDGEFPVEVEMLSEIHVASANLCLGVREGLAQDGNVLELQECGQRASRRTLFILPPGGVGPIQWKLFPDLCLNAKSDDSLVLFNCDQSDPHGLIFKIPEDGAGPIRSATDTTRCIRPAQKQSLGSTVEMGTCEPNPPEFVLEWKDCVWGTWSEWSECSATCGGGTRARATVPNGGGRGAKVCGGQLSQFAPCNQQMCGLSQLSFLDHDRQPLASMLRLASNNQLCVVVRDGYLLALEPCAENELQLFVLPGKGPGPIRLNMDPNMCIMWENSPEQELEVSFCAHDRRESMEFELTAGDGGSGLRICSVHRPGLCISQTASEPMALTMVECEASSDECSRFSPNFMDCAMLDWTDWSPCSVSCNRGIHTRKRSESRDALQIQVCQRGVLEELVKTCGEQACPPMK